MITPEQFQDISNGLLKYHYDMMLKQLKEFKYPDKLDRRNYLSLDEIECTMLIIMIEEMIKECQ